MERSRERLPLEQAIARLSEVEPGPSVFGTLLGYGDEAVEALEAFLRGPTLSVPQPRCLAAEILAAIGTQRAIDSLRRAFADSIHRAVRDAVLADAERTVASAIADHIGALGDRASLDLLLEGFRQHAWPGVARALGRVGDARAVIALAERLTDDGVRDAAMEALRRLGRTAVPALSRVLLSSWDPQTIEPATHVSGRAAAARLLGETTVEHSSLPLIWCLTDSSNEVRLAAATALAGMGPDHGVVALPHLIDALGSEQWLEAETASDAIAALGYVGADALSRTAQEPSASALRRRRAIEVLGRIGTPDTVSALSTCAGDPTPSIRLASAIALIQVTSLDALPALDRLSHDESPEIRVRAVEALGHHDHFGMMLAVPMLGDPDERVRRAVRKVVLQVGQPAAPILVAIRDGRLHSRGGWRADHCARREAIALLRTAAP